MPKTLLHLFLLVGRAILKNAGCMVVLLLLGLLVHTYFPIESIGDKSFLSIFLSNTFLYAIAIGFFAQLVDGSLGMAYGLSVTTLLNGFGFSQAVATATVHTSEIFTSGISGWYHFKFGNVNRRLVYGLIIPGVLGAVLGALSLSVVKDYHYIVKPVVGGYTLFLAITVFSHSLKSTILKKKTTKLNVLAFSGGFLDSAGGGGWGPLVGSNLLAKGRSPIFVIGSVNLAEFFIAFSSAFTFLFFVNFEEIWLLVLGLIFGGSFAAPIAALIPRLVPVRLLYGFVGIVLGALSIRNIVVGLGL